MAAQSARVNHICGCSAPRERDVRLLRGERSFNFLRRTRQAAAGAPQRERTRLGLDWDGKWGGEDRGDMRTFAPFAAATTGAPGRINLGHRSSGTVISAPKVLSLSRQQRDSAGEKEAEENDSMSSISGACHPPTFPSFFPLTRPVFASPISSRTDPPPVSLHPHSRCSAIQGSVGSETRVNGA